MQIEEKMPADDASPDDRRAALQAIFEFMKENVKDMLPESRTMICQRSQKEEYAFVTSFKGFA